MTKKLLTSLIMMIFLISFMPAQEKANEEYIEAMTTSDINQKAQLLKQWVQKYGGQGTQYENFAYATLATLPYQGKTPQETVQYGEKALEIGGLDDSTKTQVLIHVASVYINQGQNLDKAASYAQQVVQTAQKAKSSAEGTSTQAWDQLIGAGHYTRAQALEKAGNLSEAVAAYQKSYSILKNKQIISSLFQIGKNLYNQKNYSGAVSAFTAANAVLNDFATTAYIARSYHRAGNRDKALEFYKKAFAKQKSGEIAYNTGIILANQAENDTSLVDEAIEYLLYASFLSESNSEKAMTLAEGLYFSTNQTYNQKVKELQSKSEELNKLTETFNEKFGEKTEEDLTEAETEEMNQMLERIETLQNEIAALQEEQKAELAKFQELIDQIEQKLGI
jgi:tetratricopeptide (TPR) repeat protein